MHYPENWDLETFFKGGSESTEFQTFLNETGKEQDQLEADLKGTLTEDELVNGLVRVQEIAVRAQHAGGFVSCLTAQNVKDKQALLLQGQLLELSAKQQNLVASLDQMLAELDENAFAQLIARPELEDVTFNLNEKRQKAKDKLSPEEEKLASGLAIDGYHAWGNFYNQAVGRMEIPFEEDGETKLLSAGQLQNRMNSSDRSVREKAFKVNEEAWQKEADVFSQTLNHLAGFRLKLYEARGWTNVLKEPLSYNRMQEQTLNAMWDTITANKPALYKFMEKKAELIGVDKLSFHDVTAPLPVENDQKISYQEACELIIKHFRTFSPELADFTEGALRDGWIEAEDRPGKRPGGFCTGFPLKKQSRIFMTYDGSMANVATLAHELGHAYHTYCLKEKQPFARQYAMNVAETASTFAETIVADALVEEATDKELKLSLLENKISRALAFFMNIHARFLFETRFYEARKTKSLSVNELNALMEEAQREAYGEQLSAYSPTFWASKLHFHITGVPFYNFPYTFGYLFSLGIYKQAAESEGSFEQAYISLLEDTASMTVEELAQKHLQADLTDSSFWQQAIDVVLKDVEEFVRLSEQ
ncbi:M3 family oligoendopeptidase [Alkalicoccobacillus gibsonii]|jgi:oligoendopeptidase F|uniref:M3 family oligoendopeptidase n=1 Tax=Alkalicoccobacillus gibsonii TaxID=79881 RepID=A0ABU9VFU8_9BACI|nr:M3 family oligoendopeptidase [Alkalicoccobacillus gibsonii]MBM0067384.1 M3 family oligoendopeptidase [Alkalicoccobacillus gibsonii]